eukprot:6826647-Pyramimonas_sp.AAC.1
MKNRSQGKGRDLRGPRADKFRTSHVWGRKSARQSRKGLSTAMLVNGGVGNSIFVTPSSRRTNCRKSRET